MRVEVFCSSAYRKAMFSIVYAVFQVHRTSFYLGIPRLSRLVIKRFVLVAPLSHSRICAVIIAA